MEQIENITSENTMNINGQQKTKIALSTLLYCSFITILLIIGVPFSMFLFLLILGFGFLGVIFFLSFPLVTAFAFFLVMPHVIRSIREKGIENAGRVTYFNLLLNLITLFIVWCFIPSLSYIFTSWHLLASLILLMGVNMLSYYLSFLLFSRWRIYFVAYVIITIIILGLLSVYAYFYHQKQEKQQIYNKFNSWNYQLYLPPNYKNSIQKVGLYPNEHTLDLLLQQPWGDTNDIWETRAISQIPEKNCYLASSNVAGVYYGPCIFFTVSHGTTIYKFNNEQGYFEIKGNTLIYGYSNEGLRFAAFLASFQPVSNQILSQYSIQNYEP